MSQAREYRIEIRRAAVRRLAAIPKKDRARIDNRILALAHEPRPHGVEKLTDTELYRIRIGNYRVVYSIDDRARVVVVEAINDRKDIYRDR